MSNPNCTAWQSEVKNKSVQSSRNKCMHHGRLHNSLLSARAFQGPIAAWLDAA